jgi:hypothetical protein
MTMRIAPGGPILLSPNTGIYGTKERRSVSAPNRDLTVAYRLSAALAVLLLVASVVGLFVPSVYRDPREWADQARGINLVDLVITLPTLAASIMLASRGSWRARIVWLGILGYVLYDEVIFAFDVAFNPLFLVYVGILSLSFWSLIVILTRLDVDALRLRFSLETTIRAVSLYLLAVAALFFLVWMKGIVPAILSNTTPADIVKAGLPTNPVHVLDLGFLLPAFVLAAIWLMRRRPWGYALAGPLLVIQSILGLNIIASALFPLWDGQSVSLAIAPLFVIIIVVSVVLAARYLRSLREVSF